MRKTVQELQQQRAAVLKKAHLIWHRHDNADREHTPEELAEFDALRAEAEDLRTQEDAARQYEERALIDGLVDREGNPTPPWGGDLPHGDAGNTRNGTHSYSVLKAIRQSAGFDGNRLDGIELETSQEIARRSGRLAQGFFLPLDIPIDARHRSRGAEHRATLDSTAGAGGVPTTISSTFFDILRNKALVQQLGAQVLTGLVGTFAIPKQTAAGSAAWVSEGSAASGSSQTIGQVSMTPQSLTAWQEYQKKFVLQTSVDVENFVRNDLATVVAIELDRAALNGSGSGAEPTGILQNGSVTTVAIGANGGAPTWAKIVELEQTIDDGNALDGSVAFLTTPKGRGKMKTVEVASNTGIMLWNLDTNNVNSYPAYSTKNLPNNLTKGSSGAVCSAAILGDWSSLLIGLWGGLDVVVNPYSKDTNAIIRVTLFQEANVKLRYTESFAMIKDMTTT